MQKAAYFIQGRDKIREETERDREVRRRGENSVLETLIVAVCETRRTFQSSSSRTMGNDNFFSQEDLENFVFTTFSTGDIGGLDPQATHAHVIYKLQIIRKNFI